IVSPAPGRRRFADDALLDAALEVFHARGYHAAQMTELALRAGTTKPTLYARLGSKEQIYVRVLEREAALLKRSLYDAYERAAERPVHEMVEIAMLAFFDFAQTHQAGFELLFGGEPGRPGERIGEAAMEEVIRHVAGLVEAFTRRGGRASGVGAELLAAAAVGVAREVCRYALDNGHDLDAAGRLATAFTDAGMLGIDPAAIERVQAAG
ncbi:MAG TPA: helix-turn-helix domain-containing protein, partial [Solirubrobacteraceae bacterium]|nr:helix-turn-helix domain-containing protein [Solirubrobacteraceae bacterium]